MRSREIGTGGRIRLKLLAHFTVRILLAVSRFSVRLL